MSPSRFLDGQNDGTRQQQQQQQHSMINGPRPSPLKIKKESHHTIHKQQQIRKPVIIYTHSPKVIHTKPRDFMALVQKLTGLSRPEEEEEEEEEGKETLQVYDQNYHESSDHSGIKDEKDNIVKENSTFLNAPLNPYLADIPLFTPSSYDYFCSPRPLFRFSDMVSSSSPNMASSFSPASFVELMKGLPEC